MCNTNHLLRPHLCKVKKKNIKYPRKTKASKYVTKLFVAVLLILGGCDKEEQWAIVPNPIIPNANKRNEIIVATIPLGTASHYTVLAANTIVNHEESIILGDVGVGSKSIIGFKSNKTYSKTNSNKTNSAKGEITGAVYASNARVSQAHNNAVLSYYFLINQPPDIVYKNINQLDDLTFTPGIYYLDRKSVV